MNSPETAPPAPEETWTVHRQDDNGNRFVMQKHLTKDESLRMVAEFEARGHKQYYWAEEER